MDHFQIPDLDRVAIAGIDRVSQRVAAHHIPLAARPIRDVADGRADLLAESAGLQVGHWLANPRTEPGSGLVGAGLMIWAGADLDQLGYWVELGARRRAPGAA